MRYPRSAHNKPLEKEKPSAQNKPTGTKRKRTAAQDNPASARKKTLAAPKRTPSAQKDTDSAQENTPSAQINPPVTAMQPQIPRHGLDNSPLGALATELRRSIVELQLQNLRKVAIVPKSMLQGDDDDALDPNEPSLVFATKAALSKTCHALHTEYAEELESQVLKCNVPNLALHVCDFDFTPLTRELFSKFKDSHRAFFARAGAITIHLRLTPSFFDRVDGENGRVVWLAGRDLQRRGKKNGLIQWLEWRKAEEKAGRKVPVAYRLERNYEVEGVEDREALRQFMLLFDPLSRDEGDVGRIVQEIIRVFKVIKGKEDREAQEEQEESEEEGLEKESEEESEEEEDSEVSE